MDWVEANGLSLRYELKGDGPLLVLLHEIGGSLESWEGVVDALGGRFRILRYDQRGSGASEKPRRPFGLDDLTDDLEALLAALGVSGRIHLVGCALGAAQALVFARRHPNHTASLSLLSPGLSVDPSRAVFMRERSDRAAAEGMRAVLPITLERAYPPAVRRDLATYRAHRGRYLGNDPQAFALMNDAMTDVMHLLPEIRCPTLFVAGRHDVVRPPALVAAAAMQVLGSRYTVIDAAHFMAVQAPDEVARCLIDFLGFGATP